MYLSRLLVVCSLVLDKSRLGTTRDMRWKLLAIARIRHGKFIFNILTSHKYFMSSEATALSIQKVVSHFLYHSAFQYPIIFGAKV